MARCRLRARSYGATLGSTMNQIISPKETMAFQWFSFPKMMCGHTITGFLRQELRPLCVQSRWKMPSRLAFSLSFSHKMALVKCPCAFRLRRLVQNDGAGRCAWHFPCKFPHKMVLMTCPCAFRLRRLAQNVCRGTHVRHFPCICPHPMALVTCPCAFRVRRLARNACRGISVLHFPVHTGSCGLFLCLETPFRELAQRSCQETCYVDLVRRSCQETSHRDLSNRTPIEILYRDLGRRPLIEILYRDLVKGAEILLKDVA